MHKSHSPRARLWAAAVALLCLALVASATLASVGDPYTLAWFSVDGGGATSAGGGYALVGVAGQADADVLSGGPYTLQGGFLAGAAPPEYELYAPLLAR